jgi:hypothetical protein
VLNGEETLATVSTTFAYRFPTAEFHLIEFKGVVGWELRGAHLLLRQVLGGCHSFDLSLAFIRVLFDEHFQSTACVRGGINPDLSPIKLGCLGLRACVARRVWLCTQRVKKTGVDAEYLIVRLSV